MSVMQPAYVPQTEIATVYDRIAPIYDLWARLTETRARRRAVQIASPRDGEALLEVAVGTGLAFADLAGANLHGRNVGVDLSPGMLARARARVDRLGLSAELLLADAHALPFPDRSFDLLANSYMFDLLPERDFGPVLAEFRRVLAPGGRLVLVNMGRGERLRDRFYEWLYARTPRLMGGCRGVALSAHVESTGFREVHRETLTQFGFPTEILSAVV